MFEMGGRGCLDVNVINFVPVSHNLLASINEVVIENVSFAIKRDSLFYEATALCKCNANGNRRISRFVPRIFR